MKLEEILGEKLGKSQGMDEDGISVLVFGLAIIKSMAISFLGIIIVGLVIGQLLGTLAISITQAVLKSITGGPHCSNEYRCAITGMLTFGVLGYISPFIWPHFSFGMAVLALLALFVSIVIWAPQDCAENPIKSLSRRRRLKTLGLIAASGILGLEYYLINSGSQAFAAWIAIGSLWQAILLSPLGVWIIKQSDQGQIKLGSWILRKDLTSP